MSYYIKDCDGRWLTGGYGYTDRREEAGVFSLDDMRNIDLDGCTLVRAEACTSDINGECEDCGAAAHVTLYHCVFHGDRLLCAECIDEREGEWWPGSGA